MHSSRIAGIILLLFLLCMANACYPVRYDGPYKGRVVDAETGNPIEGVVVLGVWYKEIATAGGGVSTYYDAKETVTDKNGEFEIQGRGLRVLTNIGPMHVLLFKAGYEYIGMGLWESLKLDGGLMKEKVLWEGERAIIPLRKLTMEERKDQGTPSFPSEAYSAKKIPLVIKEINREEEYFGRSPYPQE